MQAVDKMPHSVIYCVSEAVKVCLTLFVPTNSERVTSHFKYLGHDGQSWVWSGKAHEKYSLTFGQLPQLLSTAAPCPPSRFQFIQNQAPILSINFRLAVIIHEWKQQPIPKYWNVHVQQWTRPDLTTYLKHGFWFWKFLPLINLDVGLKQTQQPPIVSNEKGLITTPMQTHEVSILHLKHNS